VGRYLAEAKTALPSGHGPEHEQPIRFAGAASPPERPALLEILPPILVVWSALAGRRDADPIRGVSARAL